MSFFGDIAGTIGSIASGGLNWFGQNSANQTNKQIAQQTNAMNQSIAQQQMDFQNQMSSTAWQRGVADMKAAGINPIMAASQGGASSPSGAAIGAVTGAPMQNSLSRATESFNSAMNARIMNAQLQQIRESTRKTMSDIDVNNVLKANYLADANLKDTNASVARRTARNMDLALPGMKVESDIDKSLFGTAVRYLQRANPFVHSAVGIKKAFK